MLLIYGGAVRTGDTERSNLKAETLPGKVSYSLPAYPHRSAMAMEGQGLALSDWNAGNCYTCILVQLAAGMACRI